MKHSFMVTCLVLFLTAMAVVLDQLGTWLHDIQASAKLIAFVSLMEYVAISADVIIFFFYVTLSTFELLARLWKK